MGVQAMEPETLAQGVARRVRGLMGESRVSGRQLALQLGMTQQAFSRRTTGAVTFSLEEVSQVASALGVTEAYLLGFGERGAAIDGSVRTFARQDDDGVSPTWWYVTTGAEVIELEPFLTRRAAIASAAAVTGLPGGPAVVLRFPTHTERVA